MVEKGMYVSGLQILNGLSLCPADLRSCKWKQGHEGNGLEDSGECSVLYSENAPRSAIFIILFVCVTVKFLPMDHE